jgi:hypothetical protein
MWPLCHLSISPLYTGLNNMLYLLMEKCDCPLYNELLYRGALYTMICYIEVPFKAGLTVVNKLPDTLFYLVGLI